MQKLKLASLSILSGLLMGVSWPETGNLAPLFFIALTPLLFIENLISTKGLKSRYLFYCSYLTFLTFNTYTTWWIWFASDAGMIMAVTLNSLFMATIFLWFHSIKKKLGAAKGYMALIVLWIGFEWLHYNWDLSHPWSSFGNVFANHVKLVQWYEYTGVLGGTLWLLIINILVFNLFKKITILNESIKSQFKSITMLAIVLISPIVLSLIIYNNYTEQESPIEVVIVQPNIDPYTEKFGGMTEAEQVDRILSLAREKTTLNTDFVIAPETAIPRGCVESELEFNYAIIEIRRFLKQFPNTKFIIGASTYIDYPKSEKKPTGSARLDERTGGWYDAFNSALQISNKEGIKIYHKSKLVLGVEKLPFAKLLSPLEKFAINLGGTMGSLGTEKEALIFENTKGNIAPVICYESIYGDYFTDYINKGSDAVFIITNDGWWEDTPGYKQHLAYARLRSIETRRSIARSANTGISCTINQKGEILNATEWWKQDVIQSTINLNNKTTTYTKYGDYIGRLSAALAVLFLLLNITLYYKNKGQSFD